MLLLIIVDFYLKVSNADLKISQYIRLHIRLRFHITTVFRFLISEMFVYKHRETTEYVQKKATCKGKYKLCE